MNKPLPSSVSGEETPILPMVHDDFLRCLQTAQTALTTVLESGRPEDEARILGSVMILLQAIRTRQPDKELSGVYAVRSQEALDEKPRLCDPGPLLTVRNPSATSGQAQQTRTR